ncbi:amidohydrolase family protein [Nocardia sp. IBHARD005]|uniref:amidohydrolase family protein n=1 Tax=Nocardia sp. IBHARD005 TaxID=3457765 RepID=UPI004058D86E
MTPPPTESGSGERDTTRGPLRVPVVDDEDNIADLVSTGHRSSHRKKSMGRISRRSALRGGAAALAAAAGTSVAIAATRKEEHGSTGGRPARIDIHHHCAAPKWVDWAESKGLLVRDQLPYWVPWDLNAALSMMDSAEIETAVIAPALPVPRYNSAEQHKEGLVVAYEAMAELVAAHPDRFAFFATLPLENLELANWSCDYGFEAGAVGAFTMTHDPQGRYLGDPAFDDLFANLNERHAVLNLHPTHLPGLAPGKTAIPGIDNIICDYPLDTTRAAVNMILHSTLDRYPNLSVILPHGGGFLPYIAARIEVAGPFFSPGIDADRARDYLRRFYYDSAAPMSPGSTPTLLATVDPTHIIYGSDWPLTPTDLVLRAAAQLDSDPALDESLRSGVNRDNAANLLTMLRQR